MTELLQSNISSVTRGAVDEFGVAGAVKSVPVLAWSNPLAWWWGLLTLVSGVNIAVWFLLYRQLHEQPAGSLGGTSGIELMLLQTGSLRNTSSIELMLLLCAAYVFGCAFRSFLPRADVQRICLFDTWLSSVVVGRSVATVAEICFAAQWAIILHQLGTMTGADTTLNAAWVIVPLILIAECFSWYAVLTTHYLGNAIENSIWAVAFFIGRDRPLPVAAGIRRSGSRGPRRHDRRDRGLSGVSHDRRRADVSGPVAGRPGRRQQALLRPLEGLRDVSTRWVVTHDLAEWKDEIAWMSLYFSAAVWASLALCVVYSLEDQLPRYRTEAAVASRSSDAPAVVGKPQPVVARHSA